MRTFVAADPPARLHILRGFSSVHSLWFCAPAAFTIAGLWQAYVIAGLKMRISGIMLGAAVLFSFAVSRPMYAQTVKGQDLQKSCAGFVQGFYDWYVAKPLKETKYPAWTVALKQRGGLFSPALSRRLKAVSETDGLDFDPFLNSQDPNEHYAVGKVILQRGSALVEIHGISSGKKNETPDVVAELILVDGLWIFVNFHYGERNDRESEDLLSLLEGMKERRQAQRK